jgi:hypothetical protein
MTPTVKSIGVSSISVHLAAFIPPDRSIRSGTTTIAAVDIWVLIVPKDVAANKRQAETETDERVLFKESFWAVLLLPLLPMLLRAVLID